MLNMRTLVGTLAVVVMLGTVVGCGPNLGTVEGDVTFNGEPAPAQVMVEFTPVDPSIGATATGYTDDTGHFRVAYPGRQLGAPLGEYNVFISGGERDDEGTMVRVPGKYNDAENPVFTETVVGGSNTFTFDIETP